MKLFQTVKLAWVNIKGNKLRSFLTMLGMIIGVASVIALVSIIDNVTGDIISSYQDMGINTITVNIIGRDGDPVVKDEDMRKYAKDHSDQFLGVSPTINADGVFRVGRKKYEWDVACGIDETYLEMNHKKIESGMGITYSDVITRRRCCVIGSFLNDYFFKGKAKMGDKIYIDGVQFTISGVLKQMSNSSEWSSDNCLYIPYTVGMRMVESGVNPSYVFYTKEVTNINGLTKQVQHFMFDQFKSEKCYRVQNMADLIKELEQQKTMLTMVVGGIAGISLLVAGIGIMNIMLVSVSERTKEIGIRKSLGAKKSDIMSQFVIEAATTSFIGGTIGIIIGEIATAQFAKQLKVAATIQPKVMLLAFGISAGIGILFGYLPANKAAKLNPIDALRNE